MLVYIKVEDSLPYNLVTKDLLPICLNKISKKKNKNKLPLKVVNSLKKEGELWHTRMAHISSSYLNKLKTVSIGVSNLLCDQNLTSCSICNSAKMTRKTFDKNRERAQYPCQIIHSDLITISIPTFHKQNRHILTVLDDYTGFLLIFVMSKKSETSEFLKEAFNMFTRMFPTRSHFNILRCDAGTEYTSSNTQNVFQQFNIELQTSEPFAHQHNGTIERLNRTLEEKIRALLYTSGFPNSFWGLAAQCATYLYNRTPHAALEFVTPFEKAYNKKPDISNIRIFGSRTYVFNETLDKGNKIAPRSTIQYLVGFRDTGYITYDPKTKKTNNVCSVKIDENFLYKNDFPTSSQFDNFAFANKSQSSNLIIPSTSTSFHDNPTIHTSNKDHEFDEIERR